MNDLCLLKGITLLFVIILSCHPKLIYGQTPTSLPEDIYLSLYPEPKEELIDRYQRIKKYNYDNLTLASKGRYDLISTVYHLYYGQDSSTYYFNKVLKRSRKRVCQILDYTDRYHKRRILNKEIEPGDNWFLLDIKDLEAGKLLKECRSYLDSLKTTPPEEKKISSTIDNIRKRDRKYRADANINWILQNQLDSINRLSIDSLYKLHESLKDFSEDELHIFSLVLHHSDDCDWNMKWTEIFFFEIQKNKISGASLLNEAIKRMYKTGEGIFYNKDSLKSKLFIEKIKKEYPELAKLYLAGI